MDAALALVVLGAVVAAVGTMLVRRRRPGIQEQLRSQLRDWQRSGRYWGVRVAAHADEGCEAMQRVASHVFPISSPPPLPLPDCRMRRCRCYYRPYPERRRGERRHAGDRRFAIRVEGDLGDRRKGDDRRRHDDPWRGQRL